MRQKLITLDGQAWDLALKKTNFSAWVRDQLKSERNNKEGKAVIAQLEKDCERLEEDKEYWYQRFLAFAFPSVTNEDE